METVDGDCNDNDFGLNPGASDIQNGIDDDCDGEIDEGTLAFDDDGDGITEFDGDCNDDDNTIYPGAPEASNGIDDDCDGEIDEDFLDLDGDGFSVFDGDCDDTDGWVSPIRTEVCDGVDNNCDGVIDEGCGESIKIDPTDVGCGCDASGSSPVPWAIALLVSLVFRRRRQLRVDGGRLGSARR